MIPLIILEDDEKIRNYLVALITGSGDFNLIASFSNAEEAKEYFETGMGENVDLALTDIQLPGMSGIDFTALRKPLRPHIQFMVLSVYDDPYNVFR